MQNSDAVKGSLQDAHLLDQVRPTTSLSRKRPTQTRRPVSAPPSRPSWQNPNFVEPRPAKKFYVSLNHHPVESKTSKRAPYAARTFLGIPTKAETHKGQAVSLPEYNSLSDPHLSDYFARKFGYGGPKPPPAVAAKSKKKKTKKAGSVVYKLEVTTGDKKNAGTDAKVFVELKGTNGKITKKRLVHGMTETGSVTSAHNETAFRFPARSIEVFKVRGADIGELRQLTVEHDGTDRKQSWFLEEIKVTNAKTKKSCHFPCHQWLSLYEGDCQIKRVLNPVSEKTHRKTVYEFLVETGDVRGAGTDAHVFVELFGKKGNTPKIQLMKRNDPEDLFRRGRTDRFKLKTTHVGPLNKLIVQHDNTGFGPGWFLNKITVSDLNNPKDRWFFPCNQWLSKDEGDKRIIRQLSATSDSDAGRQSFKYVVNTFTGDKRGAGTDANVFVTMFGEHGDSGEHRLDNSKNNFERAKKDTFRLETGAYLGKLKKVRIGHDNSGLGPAWILDKVTVEDVRSGEIYEFPCERWLAKDEDDGQITRELVLKGSEDHSIAAGYPYHIHVTSGDVRNADTDARVYIIMHSGEDGEINSGKIWLENGKKDNFNRGRTDMFTVECVDMLSPLHHLTIGHDNSGLGAGWNLDKVVVDCPASGCQQVFMCQKWLADDEGDGLIERDLFESEDMRMKRRPKVVWNVWVWTSDERGSGTDANVFLTLYGNKGKSDEIQLASQSNNFEQGQLDKFKVELAAVGKPFKIRIRHDNAKPFPDWLLEKIAMENTRSKAKYNFKCGRWLSRSEDDKQIIRELPATGKDIEPLEVMVYKVSVHTADKRGAGTNANVFLNLFGQNGDTGDRPLWRAENNRDKFERGKVDEFLIEAVNLGDLDKLRVGHDGKGSNAGWLLEKVVVCDPRDPTKVYEFPCGRWLSEGEDDGMIVREIPLGGISALNTTSYHVSVKTGDIRGAGTNANVYVQIHGKHGDTGKLRLHQSKNTKNMFERGRMDQFTIEAVDIGKIERVNIGHDGKGMGAGWYMDEMEIDVPSRGEKYIFPCRRWLAEDEDDGKIERELYPLEQQISEAKTPWEVTVHTGDVRGAGTDANVFLVLYGEKGKSDEFKLRNKTDNFERAMVDTFKIESENIAPLTKIRIGHDNGGMGAAWFLDKVEIRRARPGKEEEDSAEDDEYHYVFLCNKWLAKNEDDGQTVRELVPSGDRKNTLKENSYKVHVFTGDVMNAGTNANVLLTICGDQGDSGERKLEKSETYMDKFERGHEDVFTLNCINLGKISKLKLRHDNTGMKSSWFVARVEIDDKEGEEKYVFPCERWLSTSEDDGQISRELIAISPEEFKLQLQRRSSRKLTSSALGMDLEVKAQLTTYEVAVTTGDVSGASTDANVFIVLYGEKGDSGKIHLKTSKTHKDKFERKQTDVFSLEADLGALKKIRISHDNKGGFAGWFLDKVQVDSPSLGKKWMFPCNRWLDKSKDDGLLERELYPQEDNEEVYQPHIPYEITVYTGDVSGAGTNANVFIALYGLDSSTEDCILNDTGKKNLFERGSVDQFVKELDDVGEVIEKIRIGHDNKGLGAAWHLDKVEVRRLLDTGKGSKLYTFPCGRWFSKGKDDNAIVRELVPQAVTEEKIVNGKVKTKTVDHIALDMHKYKVHVFTGDIKNSGTDANVFFTMYGDLGDSGERPLTKSETHTNKFERNQEDIFTLEAADLGNIYKMKIRHDNALLNPSWFLDHINVTDVDTGRTFPFVCERWLAKKKEDKKIERSFYVKGFEGDRSSIGTASLASMSSISSHRSTASQKSGKSGKSLKSVRSKTADALFKDQFSGGKEIDLEEARPTMPYTIHIMTGDESAMGTEAPVYIVLVGTKCVSAKIWMDLVGKTGFSPGIKETFSVEAVEVGDIKKLEVGHSSHGPKDSWFVKDVEVDVPTSGKKYYFPCGRWLGRDKEDGKTVRMLSAKEDQIVTYKPRVPYDITVYTGDVKSAGTDSQISLKVYGSEGTTPEMPLDKDTDRFERACVDVMRLDLEDVGVLKKIRVSLDGKGSRSSWFLDKVEMRNIDKGVVSVFRCNQWLSKTEGDGQLMREIPAETAGQKTIKTTSYKVSVNTGDKRGGGTDANVFLIVFGENGDTGEIPLKQSETYKDKFERSHTDVFNLKDILSLGELTKVRISHDNSMIGPDWYLDTVDIEDLDTKKVYRFPCDHWLSKETGLVRELPCANNDPVNLTKNTEYEITFVTSDKQSAGTTQNGWIILHSETKKSKELLAENSVKKKILRRGQSDVINFPSKEIGTLTHVTVGHRPRDSSSTKGSSKDTSWFLHEVLVKNTESGEKYVFPCKQWIPLAPGKASGVELQCEKTEKSRTATIRELQQVEYNVLVFTADVAHAGTDANVTITIYGENGDSGNRPLTKKFKNLFERAQVDDFKLEILDLGALTQVRVEHDNKGFGAGWMLDKIEIKNNKTEETTIFPCNQWLDKKKGDGKICRDIFPSASAS